ncbi:MAG: 3-dehydroquinate synthase [Eubacteriales bacterium]
MQKVDINVSTKYEILIGHDLIFRTGEIIKRLDKDVKICIITDENVKKLYEKIVRKSLEESGYTVFTFTFEAGEKSKNLRTVSDILEYMAGAEFTRSDLIVALGGGIAGDIAGFVASIYLRGIDYVQIPTTFLAAADASVGGKTAVNLEQGKNLAGTFWQPALVICDCSTFASLAWEDFADGIAEAIKCACICDSKLFKMLYDNANLITPDMENRKILENIVKKCIKIKADIVEKDEKDDGIRQILNFGHTVGHAIEKCSDFEISHGSAVAQGMYVMVKALAKMGILKVEDAEQIEDMLKTYGFNLNIEYTPSEIMRFALKDKKRKGDSVALVLIDKIGHGYLQKFPISQLQEVISMGMEK